MATDLFWNESERVLFWSVTDASGDLCQRLGDSTRPDTDSARRMYEMNVRKGPPFDQVYRADSEPKAPVAPPPTLLALEPARWPGGPLICPYENLPAFKDEAEVGAFRKVNGTDSLLGVSTSITEKWTCAKCGCIHYLATPPAPAGSSSGSTRNYDSPLPRYRREAGRF